MTEAELKLAHGAAFRRCLIECDVEGMMKLWVHVAPHLPQPSSDREALYSLHMARTAAQSVPLPLRRYSERWLQERGFGSLMPKEIERGYRERHNHTGG